MVVDYTTGAATNDRAKQDKAVDDLVGYTQDFGAFPAGANPNLPKPVVADLVKHHVLTLKAVIDAQVARDDVKAFAALRAGAGHMQMIADPLAGAIVKQFPGRIAGATDTQAASLRTALNLARREPVYLAPAPTGAALGGRDAEFKAAAGAGRQLHRDREGDRFGVWAGRRDGLPAALAQAHRHGGGLYGGRGLGRPREAGQGSERADRLHAGLRGVPRRRQSEPGQVGRGRPGQAPRGDAEGRDRRAGRQGSGPGLHRPAHRRRSHADDRGPAGRGHRHPVPRQVLRPRPARSSPPSPLRGEGRVRGGSSRARRYSFPTGFRRTVGTPILMNGCASAAWQAVHAARMASMRCLNSARSFARIASMTCGYGPLRNSASAFFRSGGPPPRPFASAGGIVVPLWPA